MRSPDLKEIASTDINRLDILWAMGYDQMQKNDLQGALLSFKKIIKLDPQNASARNRVGIILARSGKLHRALRYFLRASRIERSAAALHNIALCYFEIGKYNKSVNYFEDAILIDGAPNSKRLIALAKAYENTKDYESLVDVLKKAAEIDRSNKTKQLYIDAYRLYSKKTMLSSEVLNALQKNRVPWDIDDMDGFSHLIDTLKRQSKALNNLNFTLNKKRLSPRSRSTITLIQAYVHNLNATIILLEKNYSLAASQTARSLCEIYLQIGYGLSSRSNTKYASIERKSYAATINNNNKIASNLSAKSRKRKELLDENSKLTHKIGMIQRRYKNLELRPPSPQAIALRLDKGIPASNYDLYKKLFQYGSEVTHSSRQLISRSINLSGTPHIGIFADSLEIARYLTVLSLRVGKFTNRLPERSSYSWNRYVKYLEANSKT